MINIKNDIVSTTINGICDISLLLFTDIIILGKPMTKTTHDWEWFIYTTYKNGDDANSIVLPTWRFPKMGVPPNHPFKNGIFHQKNLPAIGEPPFMENPISIQHI